MEVRTTPAGEENDAPVCLALRQPPGADTPRQFLVLPEPGTSVPPPAGVRQLPAKHPSGFDRARGKSRWADRPGRTRVGIVMGILLLSLPAAGTYVQTSGLVVIEAEHFQTSQPASGHAWQNATDRAGFVGASAMQALPNDGANINSNILSSSPVMTYLASFTNAGTFNFWVRCGANSETDSSVYVGVDGGSPQPLTINWSNSWGWTSGSITISTEGVHELNIWMREDGAYVDRILLAADPAYVPAGDGPPEWPENRPPVVRLTSPSPGLSLRVGASVALEADAADAEGEEVRVDYLSDGVLLGTAAGPPYFFAWTPPEGVHQVQALATDNSSGTATSAPVEVIITNGPVTGPTFRYASSVNRIYIENGGTATLTDIKQALAHVPLDLVDPVNKIWLLRATLFVADGSRLLLHGEAAGGDVNELRLLSINTEGTNQIVAVDADWGTLDLNSTYVTSWNEPLNGPDTGGVGYQRAYLRARSRRAGQVMQLSALNVGNSEVAYLGFNDSENYGLVWQVVSSTANTPVYGTVKDSYIHDCQLGVGTWSADGVSWTNNEIEFNTLYGFDQFDPAHQAGLRDNLVHDNQFGVTFRWSPTSGRIYITGPGSATLSDVHAALPTAPLTLLDPANNVWYAGASLVVEKGARLKLYGPAAGGDAAELRLKSDNTPGTNVFVELRADPGWLDIRGTKITSWDSAANGPDTETEVFGRAFVRARSKLDPDGVTAHESRMDVVDSDLGYLGHHAAESYGVVWKVVDTTATNLPAGSTNTLFDVVNVYGDILNSRLHHNYYGMYSYGHEGGHWANNEVDHNIGYGFDPHDDSDYLVIEDNNVHDNGWHGIIASRRCDHGIMRNNLSWQNGRDPNGMRGNGLMLHRSSDDWVVEGNRSYDNADSGIALFEVSRTVIRNNLFLFNDNAGIRVSVGASENVMTNNEFGYSGTNAIFIYKGNDPPEVDDDDPLTAGRPKRNLFAGNLIYGSGDEAIKFTSCDENVLRENRFDLFDNTNTTTLRFETSTNNLVLSNSFPAKTLIKLMGNTNTGTVMLIEGQDRVKLLLDSSSTALFRDGRGAVFDFGLTNPVPTVVYPTGSIATLTAADDTPASMVMTRNLFVWPDAGAVQVTPGAWALSSVQTKSWWAQASNTTTSVTYTVGDLGSGSSYVVSAGSSGAPIGTFVADSQGRIIFTVTDTTGDPLSASNRYTVNYRAVHNGPVLSPRIDRMINELTLLAVTNSASYADVPPVPLTYTLAVTNLQNGNTITNAAISTNGIITWTPTEVQGPGTNRFTTVVTDGSLRSTNSFLVTVNEVNTAPMLLPQPEFVLKGMDLLTVTNTATDSDIPVQSLAYLLSAVNLADNSIITNAVISPEGIIAWSPTEGQTPSINRFTTVVNDGILDATNTFIATYASTSPVDATVLNIERTTADTAVLSWPATPPDWILQENDTLAPENWVYPSRSVTTIEDRKEVIVSPLSGTRYFRLVHP